MLRNLKSDKVKLKFENAKRVRLKRRGMDLEPPLESCGPIVSLPQMQSGRPLESTPMILNLGTHGTSQEPELSPPPSTETFASLTTSCSVVKQQSETYHVKVILPGTKQKMVVPLSESLSMTIDLDLSLTALKLSLLLSRSLSVAESVYLEIQHQKPKGAPDGPFDLIFVSTMPTMFGAPSAIIWRGHTNAQCTRTSPFQTSPVTTVPMPSASLRATHGLSSGILASEPKASVSGLAPEQLETFGPPNAKRLRRAALS